jgi:nicotinate phosphoribosyltransferase
MRGDVIFLDEEEIAKNQPVKAFHPLLPHVSKTYPAHFRQEEILIPIFREGKLVYPLPSLVEIQDRTRQSLQRLRPEHKRLQNPHLYHVSLGEKLFLQKQELIRAASE